MQPVGDEFESRNLHLEDYSMWTKPVSEMNWQDLTGVCPICDKVMNGTLCTYGHSKCSNGHYEVSAGNYHVDVFVDGQHFHLDEMCERAEKELDRIMPEARKKWQESQGA